jgi:hypothetical protein
MVRIFLGSVGPEVSHQLVTTAPLLPSRREQGEERQLPALNDTSRQRARWTFESDCTEEAKGEHDSCLAPIQKNDEQTTIG